MPAASTPNVTMLSGRLSMGSRCERSFGNPPRKFSPYGAFRPVLRPLAVLSRRTNQRDDLGHLPAHFPLDDFGQGDVRGAEIFDAAEQGPAQRLRRQNLTGGLVVKPS